MVQRGGIGKGRVLANRRISPLTFVAPIGFFGNIIETYKRISHRRETLLSHFDCRVNSCNTFYFPGHYALHIWHIAFRIRKILLPHFADGSIFLWIASIHAEQQVPSGGHVVELPDKLRMLCRVLRLPSVEESQYCAGNGRIHTVQHRMVQLCCGGKALPAAFRFPFLIDAEKIRGIVPQKVRCDAHCPLYRRGQRLGLRLHGLFALCSFLHRRNDLRQLTVFVYVKCIADLCRSPTGCSDLAACEEILIILRQRLQDHPLTSLLSGGGTVITPSTRLARKNFGVMFSGSL